jgi:dihydropteroate synthase
MASRYVRPIGLVFGPDARQMISAGKAGALGGLPHIAYTHAEVIERNAESITRRILIYSEIENEPAKALIETPRDPVAGLEMSVTRVMGIVNVTPDSFSDGGKFSRTDDAIAHGLRIVADGADILDVGGESTRPGSNPVSIVDEISRIVPVISGLTKSAIVSADTRKADVMRAAATAGAVIINDVSALTHDSEAARFIADSKLPVVLMHSQGEPRTMQLNPRYDDVALDVFDALEGRIVAAVSAGIARSRIVADPGIGFGKTYRHNLDLMQQLTLFHGLGVALMVGLSRKSYIGALTGEKAAGNRMAGSVGGALHAAMMGTHILRVHDVKETVAALSVFTCGLTPDLAEL